jgi:hypothetical protein
MKLLFDFLALIGNGQQFGLTRGKAFRELCTCALNAFEIAPRLLFFARRTGSITVR